MKAFTRFAAVLAAALVLPTSILPASAAEAETTTLNYGPMTYVLHSDHIEITDCDTAAAEVTIPTEINGMPVTEIGDAAFQDCELLTFVNIPEGVTSVGDWAFAYCSSLIGVTLPTTATEVGKDAFFYCTSLQRAALPEGTEEVAWGTYGYCTSLQSIVLPQSVEEIESSAFAGCTALESVTLSDNLKKIGNSAFSGCSALYDITLPESIRSIGSAAFSGCTSLPAIEIPASVSFVGRIFTDCENLDDIHVSAKNEKYSSVDGVFMNKAGTSLILFPEGRKDASYDIPAGVETIAEDAFVNARNLKSVTIPASVTSIGTWAFSGSGLTSVELPGVETVEDYLFFECADLESVVLSDGTTKIDEYAFRNCTSLTEITLPATLETVGRHAFEGCTSLTDIYFDGTEEEWAEVWVYANNDALTQATVHFAEDAEVLTGDVNTDGTVSIADVIVLNKHLNGGADLTAAGTLAADVDQNEMIDSTDALNILKACLGI